MTFRIFLLTLISVILAGCGSSSKGPSKIVNPPTFVPPSSGPPPPPVTPPPAPRVPGLGNKGKLTVQVESGGVVTTTPDIGTCGGPADCDFTGQDRGTTVTLNAVPNEGWEFEEWDNCPGPSGMQCVVVIEALTWVKAEFDPL